MRKVEIFKVSNYMKKIIYLALIVLFILPVSVLATDTVSGNAVDPRGLTTNTGGSIIPYGYCFGILSQGTRGPQVEDLQTILKSDPTIYPEGLVTGFYGPMTKKAVERLQKKFNLQQTGNLDENTARIIMPCPIDVQLTVASPNGGETWDKAQTHEITWKLSKTVTGGLEPLSVPEISADYFWPRGRIDLIRNDGSLVKHIATVNLAYQSYAWKINSSIPNGSDYKIRIGLGPVIACATVEGKSCPEIWNPKFTFGDESDAVFSITGAETPPCENNKCDSAKIKEAVTTLRAAIEQLQKLLTLLESMS